MKGFFYNRPMTSFVIASIVATVLSAWILNPQIGPIAWFSGSGESMPAILLKIATIIAILSAGMALTYITVRLAQGAAATWVAGASASVGSLPMLKVPQRAAARTAEAALADLDAMIGLVPVKEEVNNLIARLRVEQRRREQGYPAAPMSLHMVFTGPPEPDLYCSPRDVIGI